MSSEDSSSADQLVAELRRQQAESWQAGVEVQVEELLAGIAPQTLPQDGLLELVYSEMCLAETAGRNNSLDEYMTRFPALKVRIQLLFEMHEALVQDDESAAQEAQPIGDETDDLKRALVEPTTDLRGCDSVAPREAKSIPLPKRVGHYEVVELIGEGGMGLVLKVKQPGAERHVALKMISTNVSDSMVSRFRAEMRAAARLEHPSIVPVYDVGEHNGLPFFTMACIDGKNLKQQIAEQPMDQRKAADLVRALASAIAFAHERGVIHRDLKPANVLIDTEGKPWLTDFGIAKRLDVDDGNTATGQILGTAAYMSPEQITNSGSVDAATDVYGLGAILYECLTGQVPFEGADILTVLSRVQTQAPRRPLDIHPEIDAGLEAICLRCLEKSPGDRYASAQALAEELDRFLRGEPPLVAPLSTLHSIKRVLGQRTIHERLFSAPVGLWNAAVNLIVHLLAFFLIINHQHPGWLWLTLGIGGIALAIVFWHYHYSRYWQLHPVERQSALVLMAVSVAFVTLLWMHLPRWHEPIEKFHGLYPPFALIMGMATMSHAATYSGKWMILGFVFCPLAIALWSFSDWSPLLFAVVGSTVLVIADRDIVAGGG